MKPDVLPSLFILLLSLTPWLVNGKSPPGKPIIISCQSSGNETFTCRWKSGSNGGLPTNHTLLYKTAGEERTYECPDYVSAGPNSCYFDKKLLGRSASYNITVKATNDLGSSISDPHYVDASSAGKPDPPSDLSLEAKHLDGITYVWAKWSLPPLAPGAVNSQKLNHELRLKSAGDEEWEVHFVGEKTQYQIFPLHLGVKYVVQVRRITDYGEKSKWSPEAYIQLPSGQPPGKPEVVRCRSPEKETFTCWWKPGSDGGLPTNYTLFYNMEKEKSYRECPDYITGGPNSCYFDKKHTSIWTIYNVTVKATNALGSNTSEPHYVDVAFIVETNPPVNLTLEWMDQANGKYLLLNWAPPPLADVRSGWLTLEYELRIKQEGHDWEEIFVGVGTKYQLFSLNSGVKYIVQVRCRSHGGRWSQWSSESDIQLPKVFRLKDIIVWIFVAFLSFIICSIMIWTMALKGFSMVACILPPVPGPKIPGFDVHLLKAGKADEIISALGCPVFPLTSDSSDEMEKWLVIDSEEQQLMPSNENTIQYNTNAELIHKETDGDSGRGSSESPSLLLEKSKEAGNPPLELKTPDPNELQGNIARKCNGKTPGMDLEGQHPFLSTSSPKVSTWPGSQVANSQFPRCSYHDIVDACKIALSAMNINGLSMLTGNKDQCNSECPKTIGEVKTTKLQETEKVPLNIQSDLGSPWSMPTEWLPILPAKAMDYVEVHKVNHDGALAVVPKQKQNLDKTERASVPGDLKEYTKVSTVVASHILVLMPDPKVETSPCCQEPPKKPNWCCQPNLAEKNMSYCHPAPTACKIQTGGLDYIDPNNFMCSFN